MDWIDSINPSLDISTLVVGILTAFFAWKGLRQWNIQLIGTKKSETAEKGLFAVLKIRDAIDHVRSPLAFPGEGSTRPLLRNETNETRDSYKDNIYVHLERLQKYESNFSELHNVKYLFEIYFGKEAREQFEVFLKLRNRIASACWSLINNYENLSRKDINKYDEIRWSGWELAGKSFDEGGNKDSIEREMEVALENIVKMVSKYLKEDRFLEKFTK